MSDILKKLAGVGIAIGGLEYIKYRFNGGQPLLKKAMDFRNRLQVVLEKLEGKKPIELEANDYHIV